MRITMVNILPTQPQRSHDTCILRTSSDSSSLVDFLNVFDWATQRKKWTTTSKHSKRKDKLLNCCPRYPKVLSCLSQFQEVAGRFDEKNWYLWPPCKGSWMEKLFMEKWRNQQRFFAFVSLGNFFAYHLLFSIISAPNKLALSSWMPKELAKQHIQNQQISYPKPAGLEFPSGIMSVYVYIYIHIKNMCIYIYICISVIYIYSLYLFLQYDRRFSNITSFFELIG